MTQPELLEALPYHQHLAMICQVPFRAIPLQPILFQDQAESGSDPFLALHHYFQTQDQRALVTGLLAAELGCLQMCEVVGLQTHSQEEGAALLPRQWQVGQKAASF
jgi:hypothetical protein